MISEAMLVAAFNACVALHPAASEVSFADVRAVAVTESGLHQFAVNVNRDAARRLPARSERFGTREEAMALAGEMLRAGRSVDVGPMQVNLRAHPDIFGSLDEAFDAFANVCAGTRILAAAYARAKASVARRARCEYNTGRQDCSNGYPEKVEANHRSAAAPPPPAAPEAAATPRARTSDIFARRRLERGEPATAAARDPLAAAPTPSRGGSGTAAVASILPGDPFRQ